MDNQENECQARTRTKEILDLKKAEITFTKNDLLHYLLKLWKKEKCLYLTMLKGVLNGQFVPFMPGDKRNEHIPN